MPSAMNSNRLAIGIAQLNPTVGDLRGNAARILAACQRLADRGATLLLTPELSICGYPPRDLLIDRSFIDDMAIAIAQLAAQLPPECYVLVGTVVPNPQAERWGGKPLFNSAVLLHGGTVRQTFHKRLLPTYDVFDEDRYFERGQAENVFALPLAGGEALRVGVTICEDFWNDEKFWGKRFYDANPVADLVAKEVDLLVNLSASPYGVEKQALREAMIAHSARRFDVPIVYVNQVGGNDDLIFDGNSVAIARDGSLTARGKAFAADELLVAFDRDRGDLAVEGEAIAPRPEVTEAEIWEALVLGVRDYARKCGFRRIVLGLSGGIDSALVAAIAAAALGGEQVLGVLMPSPYSSDHSLTDALALAANLGIPTRIIPIEPVMAAFDRSLAELFAGQEKDVTEENLQSRIRGTLLMAIANKFGYLLVSTGNKSEMAVGYCTLYGDTNGGLAAIADVPKMRVYALCRWLNAANPAGLSRHPSGEIVPPHIIAKPPSAELRPGQLDRDSLPPYEILDDILYRLIDCRESTTAIVTAGHDRETVERIARLVMRAEFKRRQAPPCLKIGDRAFGQGWRMPIASQRTQVEIATPEAKPSC